MEAPTVFGTIRAANPRFHAAEATRACFPKASPYIPIRRYERRLFDSLVLAQVICAYGGALVSTWILTGAWHVVGVGDYV